MKNDKPNFRLLGVWFCPAAVAVFLLLFRLDDVPGLYRDEASVALYAEMILEGLRPVAGYFDFYGAPMNSYIIAGFFSLFGDNVWVLRFSSVFPIFIGLFFYMDLVRRLCPDRALWCFWLLVSLPTFTVNGRLAVESNSLTPLFLYGGMWFFHLLGVSQRGWRSYLGYTLTGLFFYLGIWNHVMLLPLFFCVAFVYIVYVRMKPRKLLKIIPWIVLGGAIGIIPKMYGVIYRGHPFVPPQVKTLKTIAPLWNTFVNMLYTLGGKGIFALTCGEVVFSLNWLLPLVLVGSSSIFFTRPGADKCRKIWIYTALCLLLSFLTTWLIAPGWSDLRFWANILWLVPILLALALPPEKRVVGNLLVALLVLVNFTNTGVNYFYNFLQDKGVGRKLYIGGDTDTSEDFVDVRPLLKKVKHYSDAPLYFEEKFNVDRFIYQLPMEERYRVRIFPPRDYSRAFHPPEGTLVLLKKKYNTEPFPAQLLIGSVLADKNEELCTKHYAVFEII